MDVNATNIKHICYLLYILSNGLLNLFYYYYFTSYFKLCRVNKQKKKKSDNLHVSPVLKMAFKCNTGNIYFYLWRSQKSVNLKEVSVVMVPVMVLDWK